MAASQTRGMTMRAWIVVTTFRTLHKQGVIQEILSRYRMDAAALE